MTTIDDLLDASNEIGGIIEMASWATAKIVVAVERTGKRVNDLTVGELRDIITKHGAPYGGKP